MHEPSGWCTGCLRTLDEIAVWSLLDDAEKRGVWLQLSQRRVQWRRIQTGQQASRQLDASNPAQRDGNA
jgi:uncharacterized protein